MTTENRPTCVKCGHELRLDCDVTDMTYGVEFYFWVCDGCGYDNDEVPVPDQYAESEADTTQAQLAAAQERVRVLEAALRDMLYQYGDNDNTAVEAAEKALAGVMIGVWLAK